MQITHSTKSGNSLQFKDICTKNTASVQSFFLAVSVFLQLACKFISTRTLQLTKFCLEHIKVKKPVFIVVRTLLCIVCSCTKKTEREKVGHVPFGIRRE